LSTLRSSVVQLQPSVLISHPLITSGGSRNDAGGGWSKLY
jgi:hypothetical protein